MTDLTQAKADALLDKEKRWANSTNLYYPGIGEEVIAPLVSVDKKERFLLDIKKSRHVLLRGTYQNRWRKSVILARLDFGGRPHRNPDGEEIDTPHLHLYREGFGDKWAFPVPFDISVPFDLWQTLMNFMRFCNIIENRIIRG
ncbi:MAG: hypothetical protein OXH90_00580 [Paracoccaceae bacterium]|nr:hypothetical protein [Paracoccaceae bacterium]MDE2916216.1 hypothetical protein [Paracoccaceae bacterium]